jgi:hypothetical protein
VVHVVLIKPNEVLRDVYGSRVPPIEMIKLVTFLLCFDRTFALCGVGTQCEGCFHCDRTTAYCEEGGTFNESLCTAVCPPCPFDGACPTCANNSYNGLRATDNLAVECKSSKKACPAGTYRSGASVTSLGTCEDCAEGSYQPQNLKTYANTECILWTDCGPHQVNTGNLTADGICVFPSSSPSVSSSSEKKKVKGWVVGVVVSIVVLLIIIVISILKSKAGGRAWSVLF